MLTLSIHGMNRKAWLTLLVILLLAGGVRFVFPTMVEYRGDEARLTQLAQDMIDGKITLLGIPSSNGFPNSPISVYVMLVPYLLSDSPLVATLYVALLNVIGVGLLWLFAYRYFGSRIAWYAGLFYAINPWAAFYSRKIWAQDFHTPILLLGFLLGFYGFVEERRWAQVLCLPVFLIALQIHFAALALFPLYLWLIVVNRTRVSWSALLLSCVLAVLTILPYGLGLYQHHTQPKISPSATTISTIESDINATQAIPSPSNNGLPPSLIQQIINRLTIKPLIHYGYIMSGLGIENEVLPTTADQLQQTHFRPDVLWIGLLFTMPLFGALVLIRKSGYWAVFVMLWMTPVILLILGFYDSQPHYFITHIPFNSLLAGIGLSFVVQAVRSRWFAIVIHGLLGCLLITQVWWWNQMLDYVNQHADWSKYAGFSTPMHHLLDVREQLQPYGTIVMVSDKTLGIQHIQIWDTMLWQSANCIYSIEEFTKAVIMPTPPFAVLIPPQVTDPDIRSLYETDKITTISTRPDEGDYIIYQVDTLPDWTNSEKISASEQWDDSIQWDAYWIENDYLFTEWEFLSGMEDSLAVEISADNGDRQIIDSFNVRFNAKPTGCGDSHLFVWQTLDQRIDIQDVTVEVNRIE